ncbi:MAG TPA: sigma factor-like helix-turn-helix DNA-binding protein, partial [Gemmataceae bacterium]
RAESVSPREALGGWLFGVAYRTARAARSAGGRRRAREAAAAVPAEPPTPEPDGAERRELVALLDRELARLPEKYRLPVVLCELEGRPRRDVARELGLPEGTLSSRLAAARRTLARRLARLAPAGAAAALAPGEAARAAVPPALAAAAGRAGVTGEASSSVSTLAKGAMAMTAIGKLKVGVAVLAAFGCLGLGLSPAAPGRERAPAGPAPAAAAPALLALGQPADGAPKAADALSAFPPVVVKTVPEPGSEGVDPALKEIKVTYNKEMMDKSWSWTTVPGTTFPETDGEIRYEKDRRTCVLPVKLKPGTTYGIWLNSNRYHNFKDADGNSAVPYLLVFRTAEK